jgi:putative tricarboxylic transport membrane protein
VPFKGGGELATQLVAGSIDVGVLNLSEASAQIDAGDICPMVVLDDNRMAPIPDVKTAIEMGVDVKFATVRGFVTHAAVDDAKAEKLESSMLKAMDHSIYQAYLTTSGLDKSSVLGAEARGKQINDLLSALIPAAKEMGLVK